MADTPSSMSVNDWLNLIEQSVDRRGWTVNDSPMKTSLITWKGNSVSHAEVYSEPIRNAKGECPLCALANSALTDPELERFKGAWLLALRQAFGELGSPTIESARAIARAADTPLKAAPWCLKKTRLRLGQIFNIPRELL